MRHNGTGGPFYRDEACGQADDLADDQALVIDAWSCFSAALRVNLERAQCDSRGQSKG